MKISETFSYAYALIKSDGVYKLVDADAHSPGVNPVAVGVTAVDQSGDDPVDSGDKVKISDVASGSLGDGDKYTFVGTADLNNHSGLIIEDNHGNYFFLTDTAYSGNLNGHHGRLADVNTHAEVTFCFMPGTMIRTPDGEVAVETLKRGDLVLTHDGQAKPVSWLGLQTISTVFARQAARAADPDQGRRARRKCALARSLDLARSRRAGRRRTDSGGCSGQWHFDRAREANVPTVFTYYHVEVDDHSLILAENTPAETFVDNVDRLDFDNWAEHQALYPEGKSIAELPYPRAKSHRQVPVTIRVKLADRAQAIGAALNAAVA